MRENQFLNLDRPPSLHRSYHPDCLRSRSISLSIQNVHLKHCWVAGKVPFAKEGRTADFIVGRNPLQ